MLVLTRKLNQEIRIGSAVVRITKIQGGKVSVSIEAPKEVPVVRGELKREAA